MEVGVDFGTTKAIAAWEEGGEVRVSEPVPSVVWFEEGGKKPPHVGHVPPEDSSAWVGQPGVKRQFGDSGKRRWFPQEVAAHVLGELRARLPSPPAGQTLSAVLTAPASWGMRQRAVLREAAELAGFQVRRIVPEPEALAVWWSRQPGGIEARALLTVNFGGGTIDVAVVETDASVVQTVAIGGAPLGGFDLDALVLHHAAQTAKVDPENLRGARLRRFMAALENAKIGTLAGQNGQLRFWRDEGGEPVVVELRGEDILKRSEPLLAAACQVVRETWGRAGSRPLAHCLLIGGSGRIQRFRSQLVSDLEGTHLHECRGDEIARGALIHAHALARRSGLLLSALPRPVGILLGEGKPCWMLQQGHSLPCRQTGQFAAKGPRPELRVHVVEGGAQPGTHELLGTVSLVLPQPDAPQAPAPGEKKDEELPFGVTLDMDAEFEIVAEVRAAGQGHRETVRSPARLNPTQKSVMGRRIGEWVESRRAAHPREARDERLQAVAREAKELAGTLERKGVAETARRLREVAELATHHLAAGSRFAEGETRDWEQLRSRARLLRALGSVEGDWSVPSTPLATDSVSLGDSLLAAAKGADRQWLTEAQAELSSARKAGTLRATVHEVLPELPVGRGRQVLAVLAAPALTAPQLGQMLSGAETPWDRYTASCVALVSEEPEVACGALGLLLDWADRAREDDAPLGLAGPAGTLPPVLSPLRALYPEGFVSPFAWLLWTSLRPGMGRDWLPGALASRPATPLTRAVLGLATGRLEAAPGDAPRRLRLACELALALAPQADKGALERLARWREEDVTALERAVDALKAEARTRLVARAAVPGQEAFLGWLLARFSAAPGGLVPLLRPTLERTPEQVTLWRAIVGFASRELEQLAVDVLLRGRGSSAAQEGPLGYLRSLTGKVGASAARFYELVARKHSEGKLGLAGVLCAVWTWMVAPELRPAVARLLRGTPEKEVR